MKNRQTSLKKASRSATKLLSPSAAAMAAGDAAATSIVGSTLSRQELIAVEAYYHAEKRGFAPGCELDDWLAAERAVARSLSENQSNRDS